MAMEASEVCEWCLRAVTQLNVVEVELDLHLDHDQVLGQLAKLKEMVGELLEKAHEESAATAQPAAIMEEESES